MANPKTLKFQTTDTEVAVLQIEVQHLEEKFDELKVDIQNVNTSMKIGMQEIKDMINANNTKLTSKVSNLEKWRWMLMGAGIVMGSLGHSTISKLLV